MSQSALCQLPPEPAIGCCDGSVPVPGAPLAIDNQPGLASIGYRIGTFTSFRRAMLDRVASAGSVATSPPSPGPFANWREGADGDYQTVFIELWAYLADILTFYQERIANEAFIGTATQSDSARRLAQLTGYLPAPGSGASGLVAFSVAAGKTLSVAQGFRVASRAQPGRAAAVFETSSALTARAEHNAIALSSVAPTNQFAQLSSFAQVFEEPGPLTIDLASELYPGAGRTLFRTMRNLRAFPAMLPATASRTAAGIAIAGFRPTFPGLGFPLRFRPPIVYRPFVSLTTRTVVLDGVGNRLTSGDYVLTVENEHSESENPSLCQVSSVSLDKTSNTTTITWLEASGKVYEQSADSPVALYALRVRASPFGSNAPNWYTLSATLTTQGPVGTAGTSVPPYANWDDANNPAAYIPQADVIPLDGLYDAARATPAAPGWVVLVSGTGAGWEAHRFVNARELVLTDYARNARVTQLVLGDTQAPTGQFGIRDTLILTGAESLTLQNDLPLPDPVQGDTLILSGLFPNLQDGQQVIVSGNLFDPSSAGSLGQPATEVRRLAGAPLQDAANGLTTVELQSALQNQYARSTTVLLANVVAVTQGETVADEVLGSSDGSGLQSYPLRKQPLTYLPSASPQGVSSVQSTLTVMVNGLRWTEQPTLFGSGPASPDFTVTQDESGVSTVAFGDGSNGLRPPSGTSNIHARYRVGLGRSGNVPATGVSQLLSNLAGLQQVTNPQPTTGGADPEELASIRINAPASIQAFNRAVSIEDYATLARSFPGIAKASARRVQYDANMTALAHPYVQLTAAGANGGLISQGSLAGQLRSFLDHRRDPNVALRILDFTPVYVDVAVTISLGDQVPRQATFALIGAALNPGNNPDGSAGYFSFDRLDFGESLHLSAVYAFIQNIPGVSNANVTTFRRMDLDAGDPTMVRTDILIGPTEIAAIGNDAAHPENGLLVIVQGDGGFVDT